MTHISWKQQAIFGFKFFNLFLLDSWGYFDIVIIPMINQSFFRSNHIIASDMGYRFYATMPHNTDSQRLWIRRCFHPKSPRERLSFID